ncbi:MAG TPA: J domain-containing protein, partial [Pyrinomonadaceae bacterium]|nr:J domain-containing protein [Pyrinomonadaceae bacterium]
HLDRAKLERDGYVFHGVEKFSLKPETLPVTTSGNSDAELLGVSLPCSLRELQRAFRVKVKTAHPDRGGDDGSFIALRSAFVRLKRLATS